MNLFLKKWYVMIGIAIAISLMFDSCSKDETIPPPLVPTNGYESGVFIVNEGPFGNGTGTISFMNRDGSSKENTIFQNANSSIPLGSIVQSMQVVDDKGYIAVNDANKIEVVNIKAFESLYTLENITLPRYIESDENATLYISCWDNTVKIYSTDGTESLGQITVGSGPEKMLMDGQKLWVLNQGGYSIDSTISIIDIPTAQIITTVDVYPKPTGIEQDINGNIWVTCSGSGWNGWPDSTDTQGHLICINPDDYSIIEDFEFPTTTEHPEKLVINSTGDILFYSYPGGIYKHNIEADTLNLTAFIGKSGLFYGLGLDKMEDVIYGSDAIDFVQNGMVYRYEAANGMIIDSVEAGIGPGEFYFSN